METDPSGDLRREPHAAGVFATDLTRARHTLHGTIHNVVTPFVFAPLVRTCFVLARRFAKDSGWRAWALSAVVTGLLVAIFFVATNLAASLAQSGRLQQAPVGLLRRTSIVVGWGWLALLAFRMLQRGGPAAACGVSHPTVARPEVIEG